jgi:uncharacterized protein (DUF2235 family)
MAKRQRLVICFDGTWNQQDNSTNVLQHYNIVREGCCNSADGKTRFLQKKYYHPGVGTNSLDRISGGAFGIGLEQNVRDGYNWLVAHYNDGGDDPDTADEIYVFGFSRGAYTARSLVGFIASCGLLRCMAPLTVTQLWDQYCLLGRQRERRRSVWDHIFVPQWAGIRRLDDLVLDPWTEPGRKAAVEGLGQKQLVLGQRVTDLNEDEKLLVRWSRRVRITYLGVYDTVGAIGIDALAIPGVTSRLALHNNMLPTTLIQRCRHALAIDEQRSNFRHTPFVDYIPHISAEPPPARPIEQYWFIGAHSNVGGGDSNNELSQQPFRWVLEGAQDCGLVCATVPAASSITKPRPSDSYAEFGRGVWANWLRAKRHYRQIDPEPELRASSDPVHWPGGFSLQSIHEKIDHSVLTTWQQVETHPPPNLIEYARRKLVCSPIAAEIPVYRWFEAASASTWRTAAASITLATWGTLAALGVRVVDALVRPELHAALPVWLLGIVAAILVLVDGAEGWINFSLVLKRDSPFRKALRGGLYWLRATGVVLCTLGTGFVIVRLVAIWWVAPTLCDTVLALLWDLLLGLLVALPSGLIIGFVLAQRTIADARLADPPSPTYRLAMSILAGVWILLGIAALVGWRFLPAASMAVISIALPSSAASMAGLLLLLQVGAAFGLRVIGWVREPLFTANLKSETTLQFCFTPTQARNCLEQWRNALAAPSDTKPYDGPAARAMRATVAEGLWRDVLGFIPLYFLVSAFGLWFAARQLSWVWLNTMLIGCPLWLWLPLGAAILNFGQDVCHFRYLRLYPRGKAPSWPLTLASFATTILKFVGHIAATILTVGAIVWGTWRLANAAGIGWRGTTAFAISLISALVFLVGVIIKIRRTQLKPASPPASPPEGNRLYLHFRRGTRG